MGSLRLESRKYIIQSDPFNENTGGVVALHYLCHLINQLGGEAYIYRPEAENYTADQYAELNFIPSKSFSGLNAPICISYDKSRDIIVYPEVIAGNPLDAKNVVRWLLFTPGAHRGAIDYGANDLLFYFQEAFDLPELKQKRGGQLIILYYLKDIYKQTNFSQRKKTSYLIKKGFGKKMIHEAKPTWIQKLLRTNPTSIWVDLLTHEEKAAAFNESQYFFSYDPYTMYLHYAALCGAIPVVIPNEGVSVEEWSPHINGRYGIAYGYNDAAIAWAKSTRQNLLDLIKYYETSSIDSVRNFMRVCEENFSEG